MEVEAKTEVTRAAARRREERGVRRNFMLGSEKAVN